MPSALLSGHSQVPPPGASTAPLAERIDAVVQTEILAKGVPSVSVAVMRYRFTVQPRFAPIK